MKENQTNLEEVKNIALMFLNLPVEETDFSPMVVMHPIFESGFTAVKKDGEMRVINILEDEDNFKDAIKEGESYIEKCNSLSAIYVFIRKSYRLTFLKYIEEYLSIKDMSELLADAWVSSENPNQDVNCSISLLTKWFKKANKHYLMGREDYKVYKKLPDKFKIYRGVALRRNPKGLSWTRSYDKALWFANRFNIDGKCGYVQEAYVEKENVLAYFNTRGEDEIVVNTNDLINIKILE